MRNDPPDRPPLSPELEAAIDAVCELTNQPPVSLDAPNARVHRAYPYPYLRATAALLRALGGSTIAEVGSMRNPLTHPLEEHHHSCCLEGHSTACWAAWGFHVHSCDIDPAAHALTTRALANHPDCSATRGDGVEFLRTFPRTIDLLFLDGWDVEPTIPYAVRHLEAYQAAKHALAPRHIVAVDDTDFADGGKGGLLLPELAARGYHLLGVGRMAIALYLKDWPAPPAMARATLDQVRLRHLLAQALVDEQARHGQLQRRFAKLNQRRLTWFQRLTGRLHLRP